MRGAGVVHLMARRVGVSADDIGHHQCKRHSSGKQP
jgi:hypothetical protein